MSENVEVAQLSGVEGAPDTHPDLIFQTKLQPNNDSRQGIILELIQ